MKWGKKMCLIFFTWWKVSPLSQFVSSRSFVQSSDRSLGISWKIFTNQKDKSYNLSCIIELGAVIRNFCIYIIFIILEISFLTSYIRGDYIRIGIFFQYRQFFHWFCQFIKNMLVSFLQIILFGRCVTY